MKRWTAILTMCSVPAALLGQEWQKSEKTEPFSGKTYTEFVLKGKFLSAPQNARVENPSLVMQCFPGEHRYAGKWFYSGSPFKTYIDVGSVLNSTPNGVVVAYRLDDGKPQTGTWGGSTGGTSLFIPGIELDTILYGHFLPHKEGTNPSTKKIVIMVDEYLGGKIVMEFDPPDPEEAATACGVVIHQK